MNYKFLNGNNIADDANVIKTTLNSTWILCTFSRNPIPLFIRI